jgi:hypothetical protein
MATWDWPTLDGFSPREVLFGARTPKSGWVAPFTNDLQRISHAGERYRATVVLPPVPPALGPVREAFFTELASAGHLVRFGRLDRLESAGNLRGPLTVAANAAAGARSVQLVGARAAPNLLVAPQSFDHSAWLNAWGGSATIAANVGGDPGGTTQADRITSAAGGSAVAQAVAVTAGVTYTLSAYAARVTGGTEATAVAPQIRDGSSGVAAVLGSNSTALPAAGAYTRLSLTWVSDRTGTVWVAPTVVLAGNSGILLWGAQFEVGAEATPFSGLATVRGGDFLSIAGQLVECSHTGAVANDAGAITMPLVLPLRRAVTAGAAVTWDNPTGTWQLVAEAVDFAYQRGRWQRAVELRFIEAP